MEIFKLFGTIAVNNSEAINALDETGDKAQKTQSKLSKVMSGVGKGALAVGKVAATGIAVGATALGGITAKAVSAAGELEQNMGGSEAVFGKYASGIQNTAKEAFSKMGLSTSDYLATANKMGSLFKGAGFETEKAMDLTSSAMQRAADVASIMGIDTAWAMESIAGAAKGNFTMMDNLGVAMNETTLKNYALEKGITKSYKAMTQQEKIGLAMEMFLEKTSYAAGNYTKENETLAGSLGTAKAAFDNFLSGSGNVDDVINTFSGAVNSIARQVTELFPKIVGGITKMVTDIVPMIPPLLEQVLPVLITGATDLINGLVAAMPQVVSALMNALPALLDGVTQIMNAIIAALPQLIGTIVSALPTLIPILIDGFVSMIVLLCSQFASIIQPIIDALPDIIISIVEALMNNLPALIEGLITLVMGIVEAIPQIIQALVDAMPTIITLVINGLLNALPQLLKGIGQLVLGVVKAIPQLLASLVDAVVNVFKGTWQAIQAVFGGLPDWFGKQFAKGKENAKQAWSTITNFFKGVWDGICKIFSAVGSWFKNQFEQGKKNAQQAWSTVVNFFSNIWSGIKNIFSSVKSWFSNVFNGAKTAVQNAWNGITGFFGNIFNRIKQTFGKVKDAILSPFKTAINAVKGLFSGLKLNFPKIKMPHFKVSPSGWKIGDLLKGSIPKLSIDWYKKAMDNGMILDDATIFGMNSSGQLLGAGEAGSETVVGTESLLKMINGAVQAETGALTGRMDRIITLLQMFFPLMLEYAERDIVLDDGTLAGRLAPKINVKLNDISSRNARGG